MSPTFSKTEKHSVYLKEDVFHCKLMLLNRELNGEREREREREIKKKPCWLFLNLELIIEVQIQTPEANSQCSFIEKYAFCLFTCYMVEIIF